MAALESPLKNLQYYILFYKNYMRKSTINIQLERPPTKKKKIRAASLGWGFSYSTGHILYEKSHVPTKSISAHCFFRHLFSYGNLTWEKWTKSSQK